MADSKGIEYLIFKMNNVGWIQFGTVVAGETFLALEKRLEAEKANMDDGDTEFVVIAKEDFLKGYFSVKVRMVAVTKGMASFVLNPGK